MDLECYYLVMEMLSKYCPRYPKMSIVIVSTTTDLVFKCTSWLHFFHVAYYCDLGWWIYCTFLLSMILKYWKLRLALSYGCTHGPKLVLTQAIVCLVSSMSMINTNSFQGGPHLMISDPQSMSLFVIVVMLSLLIEWVSQWSLEL